METKRSERVEDLTPAEPLSLKQPPFSASFIERAAGTELLTFTFTDSEILFKASPTNYSFLLVISENVKSGSAVNVSLLLSFIL